MLSFALRSAYRAVHVRSNLRVPCRKIGQDTGKLFSAISDLDKYNIRLKSFPNVAVIGPQSSGKSSVIEAICGQSILPKGMRMATLKPVHLTTIKSDRTSFKIGDKETEHVNEAAEEIDRMNNNTHLKHVEVTVRSPTVYNSRLIDLPGLFVVSKDSGLPKKIKDLSIEHLKDPNTIPLVIHAAPSDPATNMAIKLVNKFQREEHSMGIITKIDMLGTQKTGFIEELLNRQSYPLGHGYCTVILRNDKEIEAGLNIEDKIREETEYFRKHSNFRPAGVMAMRKMISDIQYKQIKQHIPSLVRDIDVELENLNSSVSFLGNLVSSDNIKLASRLRLMIEKLVGSSLERAKFERKLRDSFKNSLYEYFNHFFITKSEKKYAEKPVNTNVMNFCNSLNANPENYKVDKFKELFSSGLISPVYVDGKTVQNALDAEIQLALSLGMIEVVVDDPQGEKRAEWIQSLNRRFTLQMEEKVQQIIHDVTEELLLDYIYSDPNANDEMTKRFAEYMIKEIGNEIYETKIKYSITSMLNLEKRPHVSIFEIMRYFTMMHQDHFAFKGTTYELMFRNSQKLKLEMFGSEWNNAYSMVVTDKLIENCYRNVAVNLLDRMVEKLLVMTMDMFNKENALKEKNKVNEKIVKLNELKSIIWSFHKTNDIDACEPICAPI